MYLFTKSYYCKSIIILKLQTVKASDTFFFQNIMPHVQNGHRAHTDFNCKLCGTRFNTILIAGVSLCPPSDAIVTAGDASNYTKTMAPRGSRIQLQLKFLIPDVPEQCEGLISRKEATQCTTVTLEVPGWRRAYLIGYDVVLVWTWFDRVFATLTLVGSKKKFAKCVFKSTGIKVELFVLLNWSPAVIKFALWEAVCSSALLETLS